MEYKWQIVTENWRKKYEVKHNAVQVISVKEASRITKQRVSFKKIHSKVANIWINNNTTEDSTESVLQGILVIYSFNLKEYLFHLGGDISDLPNLKNNTVTVEITQRWGKNIT